MFRFNKQWKVPRLHKWGLLKPTLRNFCLNKAKLSRPLNIYGTGWLLTSFLFCGINLASAYYIFEAFNQTANNEVGPIFPEIHKHFPFVKYTKDQMKTFAFPVIIKKESILTDDEFLSRSGQLVDIFMSRYTSGHWKFTIAGQIITALGSTWCYSLAAFYKHGNSMFLTIYFLINITYFAFTFITLTKFANLVSMKKENFLQGIETKCELFTYEEYLKYREKGILVGTLP